MKIPFIPTVDSVVADFTKAVEQLNSLASSHAAVSSIFQERAAEYITKSKEQAAQAARAAKIAASINNLLV